MRVNTIHSPVKNSTRSLNQHSHYIPTVRGVSIPQYSHNLPRGEHQPTRHNTTTTCSRCRWIPSSHRNPEAGEYQPHSQNFLIYWALTPRTSLTPRGPESSRSSSSFEYYSRSRLNHCTFHLQTHKTTITTFLHFEFQALLPLPSLLPAPRNLVSELTWLFSPDGVSNYSPISLKSN